MSIHIRPRFVLTAASLALAGVLAACSTPPAPPPPAPPPPPPPPPISLAPSLIEEASAYRGYMARAGRITADFADGDAIARSLRTAVSYEPIQFRRGAVAYAAVAVLQEPTYVAALQELARDPVQRRQVAAQIVANPAYVAGLKGSDKAAGLATRALRGDATRLFNAGWQVKVAAYRIQRQAWSKNPVDNREGRLMQARNLSSTPVQPEMARTALLQQAAIGAAPLNVGADEVKPPYTPLVLRAMAVAALAALGEGGPQNMAQLDSVVADQPTDFCLKMAKLNLFQCLAVSKPHYEDVFCLGQHVLMDTGQCLMKGAGMPAPVTVAAEPLSLPPPTGKVTYVAAKKGFIQASGGKKR